MYIGETIIALLYIMTCVGFGKACGHWFGWLISPLWPLITSTIQVGVLVKCCFDSNFASKIKSGGKK